MHIYQEDIGSVSTLFVKIQDGSNLSALQLKAVADKFRPVYPEHVIVVADESNIHVEPINNEPEQKKENVVKSISDYGFQSIDLFKNRGYRKITFTFKDSVRLSVPEMKLKVYQYMVDNEITEDVEIYITHFYDFQSPTIQI